MKHIILIAWLYIVILMAASSGSIARAVNVVLFLGVIPVGLALWTSLRKVHMRQQALKEAQAERLASEAAAEATDAPEESR
ncbi:hypothetical protein [Leeia oryzae]|uniref:hypothetical protein n=1 Tax=Leeia oryzae TaxID=356662 RepID=UPI00036418B3|nr:hypothetical protein [Leeia oryzae]